MTDNIYTTIIIIFLSGVKVCIYNCEFAELEPAVKTYNVGLENSVKVP